MTIAYFGTGSLGAGFVRRRLELGTNVNVWNRSPDAIARGYGSLDSTAVAKLDGRA
jgi:3-hydroxyisobutyrate dehydrogenase-like beta-hydroxyacid dehydrogenase